MDTQNLALENLGISKGLPDNWLADRPHLFAPTEVCIDSGQIQAMQEIIQAVETVVQLPEYQAKALSWAPEIAQFDPKTPGLFRGYDFHLTPQGPQLIEINTNPAGAALTALLTGKDIYARWEQEYFALFVAEWGQVRPHQFLHCIAIVDEQPEQQYFYPEFLLFKKLFNSRGIEVVILDSRELSIKNNCLYGKNVKIDFVYNRLTDFTLTQHQVLKQAYLGNFAVITPHPHAHALYADKRNFILLTDDVLLRSWGVPEKNIEILCRCIPQTRMVDAQQADWFWQYRKGLFFKPVGRYGGKGVYQGSKMTHKVFKEILKELYIAQNFIPPSQQQFFLNEKELVLKIDVRAYVYEGRGLGYMARLYRGQTTNFRHEGSGFAQVKVV